MIRTLLTLGLLLVALVAVLPGKVWTSGFLLGVHAVAYFLLKRRKEVIRVEKGMIYKSILGGLIPFPLVFCLAGYWPVGVMLVLAVWFNLSIFHLGDGRGDAR